MRRRILPRLLAVGVLVLTLAGCVRFQAELTVAPANTVDGTIVVAVLNSDDTDESREAARASADQVATGLLGDLKNADGVAVADYESDDYVGYELRLTAVPFEAFSGTEPGSLHFAREGDEIVFTGALDFTDPSSEPSQEGDGDDSNLTVSVTFPGAVSEHDGDLDGTTVSWRTTLEERVEMSARASATPAGIAGLPIALIIGIVVAVLLVVAIVVVVLVLRGRAKRTTAATAPAATAPDPSAPSA